MRFPVSTSMPFVALTKIMRGRACPARADSRARVACDGAARTTNSAPPRASSMTVVARTFDGTSHPGR